MKLSGREMQALLAATMIYCDVPFVESAKTPLSPDEEAAIDAVAQKIRAARRGIEPGRARDETWLQEMLESSNDVAFTESERRLLVRLLAACLAEVKTDGGISAFVGPGVGLEALQSVQARLMTESAD